MMEKEKAEIQEQLGKIKYFIFRIKKKSESKFNGTDLE